MASFRRDKERAIREIRRAQDELEEAIDFIRRNRFEKAENEIADALFFIARAIRRINRAERRD
jgi:hypothetical protein